MFKNVHDSSAVNKQILKYLYMNHSRIFDFDSVKIIGYFCGHIMYDGY